MCFFIKLRSEFLEGRTGDREMEATKTYQVRNMNELLAWKTKLVEETKADKERNPEAKFAAKRIAKYGLANASVSAFKTMNKLRISDDEKIVLLAAVFDARADPCQSPKRQTIDFTNDDESHLNYVHKHSDLFRVPINGAHYAYGVQLKRREMSDERYKWLMTQQFENETKLNIDDCPFEHISAYNCQKLEKLMKTKLPLVVFENKGVAVKPNLKSWREHWLKQGHELNTYKQLVYSIHARMDYEIKKLAIEANNVSVDNADKGREVFIQLIEENKKLYKEIYDEEGFLNIYRAIHRVYPNLEVSRLRDSYLFLADYNKFASYSNVIKEYRKMKSESDVLDSYSFTWPQESFQTTAHSENTNTEAAEAALAQLHSTHLLLSAFRHLRAYISRRRSEAEIRAVVNRLVDEALNQAVEEKQKAEMNFNENEEAMQAEDNNVEPEAEIKTVEPKEAMQAEDNNAVAEAEIKTAEPKAVAEAVDADELLARMWRAPFSEEQCYIKFLDTKVGELYILTILSELDDKDIETQEGNAKITEIINQMLDDGEIIELSSRRLHPNELNHLSGLLYRSLRDNEAIAVIRNYNDDIYKLYMSWAFDISISALELGVLYCTRAFGETLITMIFKEESYKTLKSSEDIANVIDMMITYEDFNRWTTPQSRAAFEEIGGIDAKRKLEAIEKQKNGNEEFAEDFRAGAKEWAQEELALHPERYEQAKEESKQPRSNYKNDYRKHLPLSDKKGYVKSGDSRAKASSKQNININITKRPQKRVQKPRKQEFKINEKSITVFYRPNNEIAVLASIEFTEDELNLIKLSFVSHLLGVNELEKEFLKNENGEVELMSLKCGGNYTIMKLKLKSIDEEAIQAAVNEFAGANI